MSVMGHMGYIEIVARADCAHLEEKERTYRGSWKRRGGVGAFMMLARKWDRLEAILEAAPRQYDIIGLAVSESVDGGTIIMGQEGSLLDQIGDLRRYLLLVEAEVMSQIENRTGMRPGTPEDGGHHARQQD